MIDKVICHLWTGSSVVNPSQINAVLRISEDLLAGFHRMGVPEDIHAHFEDFMYACGCNQTVHHTVGPSREGEPEDGTGELTFAYRDTLFSDTETNAIKEWFYAI